MGNEFSPLVCQAYGSISINFTAEGQCRLEHSLLCFRYDKHLKTATQKNSAALLPPGHHTENEKPIRIDSLTKPDLVDVLGMEYMSAEDSGTYFLSIDSLLPF